jgi:hypothetical protein
MKNEHIPPNPYPVKPPPNMPPPRKESLEAENARLKAEVERLIKAGDLLGSALILFELKSEEERQERLENWAIAKYGKLHD